MTTATKARESNVKTENAGTTRRVTRNEPPPVLPSLTSELVWRQLESGSFAVISYVTPTGEPRSSGVVYKALGHRLYVVVAPNSWKAKHIALTGNVAMTVPVRRGGLLSLVFPIPPATISFHGAATVHRGDSVEIGSLVKKLEKLLPTEGQCSASVIEIIPEAMFVTYGLGISLNDMRDPNKARTRLPVRAIGPLSTSEAVDA